jgi:hypothetical protein
VSVGFVANWNNKISVIVSVVDVAAMLPAEFIVSVEPEAGVKVTFEGSTCV